MRVYTVSYDPLSHSRHNAGDRSTKVGHAINAVLFRASLQIRSIKLVNVATLT